ncbi:MAG: hypothetical protein M1834_001258 [Cirrosporium novae-zelandiae]|nr:MAG: hypothetical protein M1834_001258 [Cirrosporium novae-zelandiae]
MDPPDLPPKRRALGNGPPQDRSQRYDTKSSHVDTTSSGGKSGPSSPRKRRLDLDLDASYPKIHKTVGLENASNDEISLRLRLDQVRYELPVSLKQAIETSTLIGTTNLRGYDLVDDDPKISESLWKFVSSIQEATCLCFNEERPEESWSDLVVYKILDYSLRLAGRRNNIQLITTKHISVDQLHLLPVYKGIRIQSRKVNYAFCLDPKEDELDFVKDVIVQYPYDCDSVNQSNERMLRRRPIFSNIEIKRLHSGQDPGIQLGTWCAAGFAKSAELFQTSFFEKANEIVPMSIPVWGIEGDEWRLYFASKPTHDEVVIRGPIYTFSTLSYVEIISLLNVLREIHHWGVDIYRPWLISCLKNTMMRAAPNPIGQ